MPHELPYEERISQSSTKTATYRMLTSDLGNGYRQYASDGINVRRDKWSVIWENITASERSTIVFFIDLVASTGDYFYWTPFLETDQKNFMVTNSGYQIQAMSGNLFTLTLALEQEYR